MLYWPACTLQAGPGRLKLGRRLVSGAGWLDACEAVASARPRPKCESCEPLLVKRRCKVDQARPWAARAAALLHLAPLLPVIAIAWPTWPPRRSASVAESIGSLRFGLA